MEQEERDEIMRSNNARLSWIAAFCLMSAFVGALNVVGLHACWKELKELNAAVVDMRGGR